MIAANVVSGLSKNQARLLSEVERVAKADPNLARILLDNLLFRANASARHSIRCQAEIFGI